MNNVQSWSEVFTRSIQDLWVSVVLYVPNLVGALLVLIIGLLLSYVLAGFARKIFRVTRLDDLMKKIGLSKEMEDLGLRFKLVDVVGWFVKWFFIVATLVAVADIIKIPQLTSFLSSIALYIPNVLVAVLLLGIGLVAGRFVQDIVKKASHTTTMGRNMGVLLSSVAKWAIYVFALMAAFMHLGIAKTLLTTLFSGLVFMLALAGGLAFGLGGRDAAGRAIGWIESELKGKRRDL